MTIRPMTVDWRIVTPLLGLLLGAVFATGRWTSQLGKNTEQIQVQGVAAELAAAKTAINANEIHAQGTVIELNAAKLTVDRAAIEEIKVRLTKIEAEAVALRKLVAKVSP